MIDLEFVGTQDMLNELKKRFKDGMVFLGCRLKEDDDSTDTLRESAGTIHVRHGLAYELYTHYKQLLDDHVIYENIEDDDDDDSDEESYASD